MYIGFWFDSWSELHALLTKEDFPDDSGPIERYAEALDLESVFVDEGVFIGTCLGFEYPFDEGSYMAAPLDNFIAWQEQALKIKKKLEATGVTPESGAVIFTANWS